MNQSIILDFSNLNLQSVDKTITIGGFVHTIRDHGGLVFIDLRSQTEILQCVIDPQNQQAFELAQKVRSEFVLKITGKIVARATDAINPELKTGQIELIVKNLELIAEAKTPPFEIHNEYAKLANEDIRLKYRYLDLRREKLKKQLATKHKLILAVRNWFDNHDFIEVQTPILANSSPEGARDFLVPSRLHPGKFYALPQAPQQFKQLLMVGGFNKYFQIAPCFRDEDPRADRHPGDFYQIDVEMAWATQTSIFEFFEKLVAEVITNNSFTDKKFNQQKFPILSYSQALDTYGSDKPDLRYGLAWQDVKKCFENTGFEAFAKLAVDSTAKIQALVVENAVDKFSRSDLDKIQEIGRNFGLPGIAYIQYFEQETKSPIFKFLTPEQVANLQAHLQTKTGDLVLFLANQNKTLVHKAQNEIRKHIAKKLDLIDENQLSFCWITDFPFFEEDEKTGNLDFGHNPFGVWQADEGLTRLETLQKYKAENRLLELKAIQYDCACNGYEILSGGVRNNQPEALLEAFQVAGYTERQVKEQFGHMLDAYTYGAPPHAGFAVGLDRLFMILQGEENIREVIAFPKNGSAMDAMLASPSEVSPKQLKELNLKID
jgi:aspartyl-tRNA synthetase